jgi:hypothetical protein
MREFERARPYIAAFEISTTAMAAWFGADVWMGGSPITPELYGPAVYAINAWYWIIGQAVCGLMAFAGCWIYARKPRKEWRWLTAIGCTGTALEMSLFAALALGHAQGIIVQAGATTIMTPLSMLAAVIAWLDRKS